MSASFLASARAALVGPSSVRDVRFTVTVMDAPLHAEKWTQLAEWVMWADREYDAEAMGRELAEATFPGRRMAVGASLCWPTFDAREGESMHDYFDRKDKAV